MSSRDILVRFHLKFHLTFLSEFISGLLLEDSFVAPRIRQIFRISPVLSPNIFAEFFLISSGTIAVVSHAVLPTISFRGFSRLFLLVVSRISSDPPAIFKRFACRLLLELFLESLPSNF